MDSLLASYASSDEEDEAPKPSSSLSFSLPPPKSSLSFSLPPSKSSLFSSLPPPKSDPSPQALTLISPLNPKTAIQDKPSSLFSSIPPPKPKKVIQFKPPVIKPANFDNSDDDDVDDDSDKKGKKVESFTEAPSTMSFLSNLPAPKKSSSTLGALPSALGSGRRSILETNVASSNDTLSGVDSNKVNYSEPSVDHSSSVSSEYGVGGGGEAPGWVSSSGNYESYDGNAVYGNYDYYGQYNSNWGDGSAEVAQSNMIGVGENVLKVPGKRGRSEIPTEIVEVKQDELIKNRPREDQIKSTGIAFGPAYQPVSTKGKPSKLQKRKHQIGSLYFDMRQKESELAERRSKGFLTKAETQAKYGW